MRSPVRRIETLVIQAIGCLCLLCNYGCAPREHPVEHRAFFNRIIERATQLRDLGKIKEATELLDSAYESIPGAGPLDRSRYYSLHANWSLQRKDYLKAGLYADSSISVLSKWSQDTAYNIPYAEAYLLKGDMLFAQGLYSYAYQYYYGSRRVISKKNSPKAYHSYLAHFNERLATISFKQEDFNKTVRYYRAAINELDGTDRHGFFYVYEKQGALNSIALSQLKLGRPDSALFYYDRCLRFLAAQETKLPGKKDFIRMARGVIYGNMGDAWMAKSQYRKADSLYSKDIAINSRKDHYNQDALMTRLKLANLFVRTGRLKEAGAILSTVGASPDLADVDSKMNFLMTRADHAQATGRFQQAIVDLRMRSNLRDSVQHFRRKLLSANIEGMFTVLEKEYDNTALKKQDRLKNYLLASAVLLVSMAAFVIWLLIRNGKASQKRIREISEFNQEQQFTLQALEQINRENSRLSGILAHDLKNPVHAISTIATLMLDEDRGTEDREMLGLIKASIMKLNSIIGDVLGTTGSHDALALNIAYTDVAALLRHSVALLRFKAAEKKQTIVKESPKELFVALDHDKIWRVFNNLLVNAIKFSPQNTVIRVKVEQTDDIIRISVADAGIGIPDEIKDKIFDLFTDARRSGTDGEETFGMGLYTSRQIVERHGGTITFEKGVISGTIFHLALPNCAVVG